MFIFSNLAISLDGKIATYDRSQFPLGTPEDRKQMRVLRRRSDAVLIGASTLRTYQKPLLATNRSTGSQPLNIILSSTLDGISPTWKFFTDARIRRLIFVSPLTPSKRIREFSKSSEIVVLRNATSKNSTASQIIKLLKARNIKRLLIEGGGGVMWDFIQENRIDEYHITLTPKVLGGATSPTLVDGVGFSPDKIVQVKLRQCRIVGDELYLIYSRLE
jgi:riboflavin-specific deaminase-like protein